ncbi:YceI family protein [Xanthomonas sp. XNM01]|uniref:YceI family protein n=1 Tax=Xanthomonas sp. XNM01 TaxID=2769289 RepID=UPI00177DBE2A|nr:YceI family protein [Xanthomonas sp. XNM01]MBD9370486.1 polyisoprenoid-binding protein [Xanthomonas sp. XNM01]
MRIALACWLALLPGLAAASAEPAPLPVERIDETRSTLGFEVRTRLGQRLEGRFPRFEGSVDTLPDGRHRVRLRIATAAAEIPRGPRYTDWMRSDRFFDTVRHPWMEFVSDPYPATLLRTGGELRGTLTLRGIHKEETLDMQPATCARPGHDCDVVVEGDIRRSRYGMDDWQLALSERVRFVMQVRLAERATP